MSALLIAEHNNKELKPFTLNAITAASQIDEDLHVLVIGYNVDEVVKSISQIPNVKKIQEIKTHFLTAPVFKQNLLSWKGHKNSLSSWMDCFYRF